MEAKRLSSLSEEREEDDEQEPPVKTVSPRTHQHHRIISFDPTNVSSLTTREIHERNEVAMSLVSSVTMTTRPERRNATAYTVNVATPQDVESVKTGTAVRPHHIVKIFTGDHDVIEVTPEQVQRIKMTSVLAGLGLVSNSSTTIIASMLVSPIMGPVIGLAYGTTIWDWHLVKKSLRNECISLAFCVAMGMTLAACTGWTKLSDDWPTEEMESRGNLQNLYVSLPVAFFSGLGVAVSILDEQTSSLVGVAISASLLPPAVDAGILWIAYAFTKHGVIPPVTLPAEPDDTLTRAQEDYSRVDYRHMGAVALGVTLANIVLIWISSMLMFRIKEVLPIEKKVFWDDLKVTRRIYQRRALLQVVEVDPADTTDSPEPKDVTETEGQE